ncbi:MAG: hypothetical protein JNM19_19350, partial [Chitinophagaceae bacterium]|nr:hypothetical protein [Chitinophagaceae bacterium]
EGKFNPKDKKEDILYFVNYYNLATLFYCLDDFEKATYYIQKLDSNNKQDGNASYFKKLINIAVARTTKHLLTTTHLDYNPVKDFRLGGKEYVSDAGAAPADMPVAAVVNTPAEPAKVYDQTGDTKKLLHNIWLAYQSWTNGNTDYSEPGNYLTNEAETMATGQQFLYPVFNKKYITIKLNITGQTIPSATIEVHPNTYKVQLTWKQDKLTGIKLDGLSEADYDVVYDKDMNVSTFTSRTMINGNITTVLKPEFANGKLSKVTKYENKTGQSPWIRSIKTFAYNDTATLVDCLVYGTNKPNTPKGIVSNYQGIYKKSNGNPYIIVQPYGETTEINYNEKDEISGKIVRKKNSVQVHDYLYRDGKLFKETVISRSLTGDFLEKNVRLDFTLENAGPSVPDDEKLQGFYKYDQNDVLIYEARDGKYRDKQNGVWSDWKYFRY